MQLWRFWSVFLFILGDSNWRQAEAWALLLAGAIEVNALAQGALRRFTQWSWAEHQTFQLRGGHSATELSPPIAHFWCSVHVTSLRTTAKTCVKVHLQKSEASPLPVSFEMHNAVTIWPTFYISALLQVVNRVKNLWCSRSGFGNLLRHNLINEIKTEVLFYVSHNGKHTAMTVSRFYRRSSDTAHGIDNGMIWSPMTGLWYSLKRASMKIRPASFKNRLERQTTWKTTRGGN